MGFRVNSAGQINQGHFSKVPSRVAAPRSSFDRSFSHRTTVSAGYIYPIFAQPMLPGDTVNLFMNAIARLATPIYPYFDNLYMDIHWIFAPNRLVWDNWERFQGAQDDPDDTTDYEVPSLDATTHAAGFPELSIYDYLGLPTKRATFLQADMPISLPLRSYYKIWNDWYRDQNYQDSLVFSKGDGPDTTAFALQRRNRRKDYFTSGLPWPQKGPAVQIPIANTAPVISTGEAPQFVGFSSAATGILGFGNSPNRLQMNPPNTGTLTNNEDLIFGDPTGLEVDLTDSTATTVNEIRQSFVLQQMLELDARGGTRYVEILLARFGVTVADYRLQRTEYLGGQTLDINVSPIAQSSASLEDENPQGNLAAYALARGRSGITHSFVEHGWLFGLVSFRADTSYQQGLNRHWSIRTRYDIYEPLAANLGEQAVLNKEIYAYGDNGSGADDINGALCYQERWAEYRYSNSFVSGRFRSNSDVPLDSWHLAIELEDMPALEDLLPENPPVERVIAVTDEPQFILDTYFKFRHVRVLPVYSAPGLTRL